MPTYISLCAAMVPNCYGTENNIFREMNAMDTE
jgi:hypothetical protein